MPKVVKERWCGGEHNDRYYIFCPGCYEESNLRHPDKPKVWMNSALHCFAAPRVHQFNGDMDSPTLSPSLMCWYEYGEEKTRYCCHSFVKDGKMQFLSDCTHPLAGQTVDLLDVPEEHLKANQVADPDSVST